MYRLVVKLEGFGNKSECLVSSMDGSRFTTFTVQQLKRIFDDGEIYIAGTGYYNSSTKTTDKFYVSDSKLVMIDDVLCRIVSYLPTCMSKDGYYSDWVVKFTDIILEEFDLLGDKKWRGKNTFFSISGVVGVTPLSGESFKVSSYMTIFDIEVFVKGVAKRYTGALDGNNTKVFFVEGSADKYFGTKDLFLV